MRKLLTILALLGIAASISAREARADGVTYTVTSTYASDTSTSTVSAPGASFTFTFTVPSPCSTSSTPPCSGLPAGFADFPMGSIDVTFSSPTLPGFTAPATLSFFSSSLGGLFDLEAFPGGNDFDWSFFGPQIFNTTADEVCPGPAGTFCTGSFSIMGGTGFPMPTGSFFFDTNDMTVGGDLTGGSVEGTSSVVAPEPSSLLLLGSGFLALGGFARKRVTTLFN
jgi:PEP-CTERM motif